MTEPCIAPDALATLRRRLHEMRAELVERMAVNGVEPAYLNLMAGVQATLGVIDNASLAKRNRGGDPHAEQRAQQRHGLRALAALMGTEVPAEQRARELESRLGRYHPMPNETNPERLLMRQVIETGLPVPGADRIARIIRDR